MSRPTSAGQPEAGTSSSTRADKSTGSTDDDSDCDNSSSSGEESATSDHQLNVLSPTTVVTIIQHWLSQEAEGECGTSSYDEPLSKLARDTLLAGTGAIAEDDFVIFRYTLQHSCRYYVAIVIRYQSFGSQAVRGEVYEKIEDAEVGVVHFSGR